MSDKLIRALVKPLEWEDDGSHRHVAVGGAETFIIADMWRAVRGSGFSYRGQAFLALAAAQAAAEADYRARIAAALDLDKIAALVEAADDVRRAADNWNDRQDREAFDRFSAAITGLRAALADLGGRGVG